MTENDRLIVEMLEVLKSILRPCDHSDTFATCPKCRSKVEAVINKAEGKKHEA